MQTESVPEYGLNISEDEIKITEAARAQFTKLFQENHAEYEDIEAIRIFVSGGGCSGMSYGMTFTDRRTEYDKVLDGGGFKLYADTVALNYLRGVEIDFVERSTGASFIFNNVFAPTGGTGACGGCGSGGGEGGCGPASGAGCGSGGCG